MDGFYLWGIAGVRGRGQYGWVLPLGNGRCERSRAVWMGFTFGEWQV